MKILIILPTGRAKEARLTKLRRLMMLYAVFAFLSIIPCARAQEAPVGYVLEMEGHWLLQNSSPEEVSRQQRLPSGGVLYIKSPTKYDYITIANMDGEIIDRRRCRNQGECEQRIVLPLSKKPKPSKMSILLDSVMTLLWGAPDRYSVHRSRGEELPEGVVPVEESVIRIKDGQVDLRPVFEKEGKGKYYVRLRAVSRALERGAKKWTAPQEFDWNPAEPKAVIISGLSPQLYELALLERNGSVYMPLGTSAWVLITEPKEYDKAKTSFETAVALTKKWGTDVTPETVRSFLRAHLDRLASKSSM